MVECVSARKDPLYGKYVRSRARFKAHDELGCQMGDTVRVKDGFARNFLLPGKKALRANDANRKIFEGRRAELEARNAEAKKRAKTSPKPQVTDPFLPFINDTLTRHPTLASTRLYDMLKERGYEGSPRRLREVIRKLRPPKPKETFAHLDFKLFEALA